MWIKGPSRANHRSKQQITDELHKCLAQKTFLWKLIIPQREGICHRKQGLHNRYCRALFWKSSGKIPLYRRKAIRSLNSLNLTTVRRQTRRIISGSVVVGFPAVGPPRNLASIARYFDFWVWTDKFFSEPLNDFNSSGGSRSQSSGVFRSFVPLCFDVWLNDFKQSPLILWPSDCFSTEKWPLSNLSFERVKFESLGNLSLLSVR